MKYIKHFMFLIFILLGMTIYQSNSVADTHDTSEDVEFDDGTHERELSISVDQFQMELESQLKVGEKKDKIKVRMKLDTDFPSNNDTGEIEIRFEYQQEANSTEISFKYRIEMTDIIEYQENGTELGYQIGEEVSSYNIGGTGWNDLAYVMNVTTVGNDTDTIHIFNATTADNVVSFVVRVSDDVVDLGNGTLTPNAVKLDVLINNFPYSQTNSSLAIVSKVKTGAELELKQESAEEELGIGNNETEVKIAVNGTQGYFSWADNAEADGVLIDVLDSPITNNTDDEVDLEPGEDSIKLFFSFITKGATSIVWDPKVGVVTNDIILPSQQANVTVTETITVTDPNPSTETVTESGVVTTVTGPAETETVTESNSAPGITILAAIGSIGVLVTLVKSNRKRQF